MPGLAVIIVSPLMRAMETAYLTFKDHPNFENVEVVIDPDLREYMGDPCGVPNPIKEVLAGFKDKFKNMDTSLLNLASPDCNYWFLENSSLRHKEIFMREI